MNDDETDDVNVEEDLQLITLAGRQVLADAVRNAYNQGFKDGIEAHTERLAGIARRRAEQENR